jgi:hypothetical protein
MWRKAWIEGDCIVVKCALDELSQYHLKDLKQDVSQANQDLEKAIEQYNIKARIQAEREEAARVERDKQLDKLNDLDFS